MQTNLFIDNRARLRAVLRGELVAVASYDKMQQTKDAAAPFRQEANFWWLTGIAYPGWKFVYDSHRDEEFLVRPQLSQTEKIFESWLSDEAASQLSGVKQVISQSEWREKLRTYGQTQRTALALTSSRYQDIYCYPNPSIGALRRQLMRYGLQVQDAASVLSKLRAIKSPAEIALLKEAIALTNEAFTKVKRQLATMQSENEVEAEFSYHFTRGGARHAYDPIVAFKERACTLHYTNNNQPLGNGLLLLDIGAEKNGYNADITRTYARGELTEFERRLHQAVQAAQAQCISLLRPGLPVSEYLEGVDAHMKAALIELGLMDDPNDKRYRQYFPHAISHGLGVDVHDSLGAPTVFESGMVLTVEPGIYVPERQAGVRIEDDILITDDGYENLSASLPTTL